MAELPIPVGYGVPLVNLTTHKLPDRTLEALGEEFTTKTELADHVSSPTPHPSYDDLPSLKLLFENGLV